MCIRDRYQTTVGDNKTRLAQALQLALQRADLVITSGGLGPTQGDLTKFVGAQVMRTPLYFDEGVYKAIEQWLQRRYTSPVITENQKRQAMIPQGATVFSNEAGTAPGTALQKKRQNLGTFAGTAAGITMDVPAAVETLFAPAIRLTRIYCFAVYKGI